MTHTCKHKSTENVSMTKYEEAAQGTLNDILWVVRQFERYAFGCFDHSWMWQIFENEKKNKSQYYEERSSIEKDTNTNLKQTIVIIESNVYQFFSEWISVFGSVALESFGRTFQSPITTFYDGNRLCMMKSTSKYAREIFLRWSNQKRQRSTELRFNNFYF